jgi:hypothetical protein
MISSQMEIQTEIPKELKGDPFIEDLIKPAKPSADSVIHDDGSIELPVPEKITVELEDKTAATNTALFMDIREMVQGGLIAMYADGSIGDWERYKYDDNQKKQLIKAWTPLIQKSGIKVSPWANVLITESMCSAPLVALAFQNRKMRQENDKLRKELIQLRIKNNDDPGEIPKGSPRFNNKNAWRIDEKGYFMFKSDGKSTNYLTQSKRKERPKMPFDYDMLVKYNDKEFVHKVFELTIDKEVNIKE